MEKTGSVDRDPGHDEFIFEGMAAVKGVLLGEKRTIRMIAVDRKKDDRGIRWLLRQAQNRGVRTVNVDRERLDEMAGSRSHTGIIALAGTRPPESLDQLIAAPQNPSSPLVAMLDGIEDPYNLGFAIRALWSAGFDGLVLRERNWGPAVTVIARSSAGASELMPTALVERPDEAADFFRSRQMRIAVTAKEEVSRSLYRTDLTVPLFILIGGEKRGVQRSFLAKADLLIHIPYGRDFRQSLGAASASGVIGFEIMRQREMR